METKTPSPIVPLSASPHVYTSSYSVTANPKSVPVVKCLIVLSAKNSIMRGEGHSSKRPWPNAPKL